jgi:hypothetical protein
MKWKLPLLASAGLVLALVVVATRQPAAAAAPNWHMNASTIEACSCPMFCQCYFNTEPADHSGHGGAEEHFCRFNNAYKINEGHYGETDLSGVLFWVAGDLGSSWAEGKMDWAVATFTPDTTPEQRAGIAAILPHLFPVEWASFEVGEDAAMEWTASEERAVARLAGGERAEVVLNKFVGMNGGQVVLHGMPYWGADSNDGFIMMPNEVEAWKVGDKAFEFSGTNGFMIDIDIASK